MTNTDDPAPLIEIGFGFWRAKALLSAVELGIFTLLARQPRTASELSAELGLHPRGASDFLDALVALGLLARDTERRYANTPLTAQFLDREKPSYLGGLFEMAEERLYPVWGKLSDALRSGEPQNEAKHEPDYYSNLTADPHRLRTFLRGMTGLSMGAARAIAERFPWQTYASFVDMGGAQGHLATVLAERHPHLSGATFDLPAVAPFFDEYVTERGLSERLRFVAGDFFEEELPRTDVLILGHVLHNWPLAKKRVLLDKAYAALPAGGALIVYEALIDDDRRANVFGLLMSLNMLLVTSGGFTFSGADCQAWMRDAGFTSTRVEHLHAADSMVVAIK